MREEVRKLSKTILIVVLCCSVLSSGAGNMALQKDQEMKQPRLFGFTEISAEKNDHQKIKERAQRLLATTYPTLEIQNFRRDQTLVFKNTFGFSSDTDLSTQFTLKSDSTGNADSPSRVLEKPKSVFWGNDRQYIVLQMDEKTELDNEYLYLSVANSLNSKVYRSQDRIYQYYDSGASTTMGASLGIAIVFMLFACCCWCCGARQFVLLIRIPQMIFMLAFLGSKPQAASYFSLLENFRHNLFSIIPNPVVIDEQNGNECQLPIQFFSEMLSCHVYNTVRNYVLSFIIFSIFYAFIVSNKFHDRKFFIRLRNTMDIHIFMLTIFPDVAIAIYLNAVAGLTNSVLSIGFFFSILLVVWYVHIFKTVIGYYFQHNNAQLIAFLKFFVFSRNRLTDTDPKLGIKLLAVMLDYLKIFIIVTMIALFYNAPKTQMVIVFLVYLFNAAFLIAVRPYVNMLQNIFFATSDIAFFIIVVLTFARQNTFDSTSMNTKEGRYGGAQSAMIIIIFIVTHCNFLIPMIKGQDSQAVIHKTEEGIQDEASANELQGKSSTILKREPEADKPHHVDQKEPVVASSNYLGKPKVPERDIHTAEGRTTSKATEGSEIPLNREEQVPMRPKESENPALNIGKKKIEIKGVHPTALGNKDPKQSEDHLLRSDHLHENVPPTSENREQPATAHQSHYQPKKNNLLVSEHIEKAEPTNATPTPTSQIHSMARLDGVSPNDPQHHQSARSSELPPVKTGKVPVRKTFKPAEVKNQDYEGM